jgi:hypothetical protein
MKEGGPEEEKENNGFTVKRGSNSSVSDDRINDNDAFDAKYNTISEPFKPFVADTSAANFSQADSFFQNVSRNIMCMNQRTNRGYPQ